MSNVGSFGLENLKIFRFRNTQVTVLSVSALKKKKTLLIVACLRKCYI